MWWDFDPGIDANPYIELVQKMWKVIVLKLLCCQVCTIFANDADVYYNKLYICVILNLFCLHKYDQEVLIKVII